VDDAVEHAYNNLSECIACEYFTETKIFIVHLITFLMAYTNTPKVPKSLIIFKQLSLKLCVWAFYLFIRYSRVIRKTCMLPKCVLLRFMLFTGTMKIFSIKCVSALQYGHCNENLL